MNYLCKKTLPTTVSVISASLMLALAAPAPSYAGDVYNTLDSLTEDGLVPIAPERSFAQQFILGNSTGIDNVTLSLFGGQDGDIDFGTPTGLMNVEIWGDDANFPTTKIDSVGILDFDTTQITNTEEQLETFDNPVKGLSSNQPYWIVLNFENANVDFFNTIGWNTTSSAEGTNGAAKALGSRDFGETWDILPEVLGSDTLNYFKASVESTSVESTSVPEPSAILGSFIALGLCGAVKRRMPGSRE